MEDTILSAFFVIYHKLYGNPGIIWPLRMGWILAVTKYVPGIIFHEFSKKKYLYFTNNTNLYFKKIITKNLDSH